ncbi:hypothetical protein BCR35DRAFT_311520 [Leucosporidium creatinivorum]|uniref:Uncharacterized protein n=1 Tax=Leucosporidium creatinivorum TaxID=106004 RepID=A0A1Y2BUR7_9BASI|nr:hypothetical protein BCR35DRAFT_311520 [Leucosporidium creatinivorum]
MVSVREWRGIRKSADSVVEEAGRGSPSASICSLRRVPSLNSLSRPHWRTRTPSASRNSGIVTSLKLERVRDVRAFEVPWRRVSRWVEGEGRPRLVSWREWIEGRKEARFGGETREWARKEQEVRRRVVMEPVPTKNLAFKSSTPLISTFPTLVQTFNNRPIR